MSQFLDKRTNIRTALRMAAGIPAALGFLCGFVGVFIGWPITTKLLKLVDEKYPEHPCDE